MGCVVLVEGCRHIVILLLQALKDFHDVFIRTQTIQLVNFTLKQNNYLFFSAE